jgi:hypothetical protein
MHSGFLRCLIVLSWVASLSAWGQSSGAKGAVNGGDFSNNTQPTINVPTGVILVKGAWSSASDSKSPVPEGGSVTNNVYSNQYFGMTYSFPPDWTEKYKGPPPSDGGRYVLAQIRSADTYKGPARGSILITADDLFFTPLPAANALQLIDYMKDNLQPDYQLEEPLTRTQIAGRPFVFFAYWSPVAQLHWYVLATQIRCHAVEVVLTSRDTKLLESLVRGMDKMQLPAEASPSGEIGGGTAPLCIKDYASDENVTAKVNPVFTEHRFNSIPVRIIIDKKGIVKHIHFLSAFPDQAKAITDALGQWKFRPSLRDGQPVEVETGIMFGPAPHRTTLAAGHSATE